MSQITPTTCKCNMASILASVVGLIDPPLYSADGNIDEKISECDGNKSSADSTKINEPCDSYGIPPISKISPGDGQITKKKKKVQFNDSSFEKRRKISVHDSIRAYDLLLHIIHIQPLDLSDELLYEKTSWNSLQLYADTYRALIVTSCLLLEMLPTENNHDDFNTTWPRCSPTCPILSPAPSSSIPVLSSSIIQLMLSTSRRCIFLLKYLERICAAKSMVDHHTTSGSTLFYIGGDDIEDYDRCTNDLHTNYDWHDDGFLPMPGSYKSTDQGTSLIHECCCRPHNLSVQPSSHYEKSASTKEWIRGERLVSFSVEDYDYYENMAHNFDQDAVGEPDNTATGICNEVECRTVSSLQVESRAVDYHHFPNMPYDETENQHVLQKQREDKNINNITQNLYDDSNEGGETPIFSLSPTALDEAEEKLLDIMVPTVPVKPSSNCISKRTKRRKRKHLQKQVEETTLTQNQICPTSLDWKEGYLLIGFNNQTLPLTMRVYAKIYPSGLLSIEDRSILSIEDTKCELSHRTRYWTYLITRSTICRPWTSEGIMSFHFRVEDTILLGSSTLNNRSADNNGSGQKVNLLFSVDEGTGGALADGFEWVSAISQNAASFKSLVETLCL